MSRDLAQQLKSRIPMSRRRQLALARVTARKPSASIRALPDFLVIGAQRCGTSSLYKYLGAHTNVIPSLRKEIEYFSTRFQEGEQWYRAHFPLEARMRLSQLANGVRPLTFEATPDYMLDPRTAQRAAELVPDARIVVLLRNPIDRAFSQYHHNRRLGHEPLTFEEALEAEAGRLDGELDRLAAAPDYQAIPLRRFSYAARGKYADHLEPWLEVFPRDQIRIVASSDLFGDTANELGQLYSFLGLPAQAHGSYRNYSYSQTSQASSPIMEPTTRLRLAGVFEDANRRLYQMVDRDFGWNREADTGARA